MKLTGFRAFLLGTAQDQLPVRGLWLKVQRRDDVEGAADQRAFDGAADLMGVSESNGQHTT
jgi:hypothetical protein